MSFSSNLQSARLDRNLTAQEASAVFGAPARTVENWEQGREPREWQQPIFLDWFLRHAPRKPAPKVRMGRPVAGAKVRRKK